MAFMTHFLQSSLSQDFNALYQDADTTFLGTTFCLLYLHQDADYTFHGTMAYWLYKLM